MNLNRILLVPLALAIGLGAGLYAWKVAPETRPAVETATLLPAPVDLPDFSLVDQDANPVGRSFFEGQWDLVFFGFTHCPDICPTTLQTLSVARRMLVEDGLQDPPRIVLISVDPARDTPEKIKAYVGYFGDEVAGLTGGEEALRVLTDGLGIFFQREQTDAENYNVDHSAVVLVLNPAGQFTALFSAPHKPDAFVNDLPGIFAL
ncbi:MAG: SCO family protein [Woeseiaceae bacterium]|nr:SCO family protein [Woeseiaceae bacterium]